MCNTRSSIMGRCSSHTLRSQLLWGISNKSCRRSACSLLNRSSPEGFISVLIGLSALKDPMYTLHTCNRRNSPQCTSAQYAPLACAARRSTAGGEMKRRKGMERMTLLQQLRIFAKLFMTYVSFHASDVLVFNKRTCMCDLDFEPREQLLLSIC